MEFYKKFLIGVGLFIVAIIIGYGFWYFNSNMFKEIILPQDKLRQEGFGTKESRQMDNPLKLEIKVEGADILKINRLPENRKMERPKDNIVLDIPFSPQAPDGQWGNPVYQDGCEEAAVLMTIYWLEGRELSMTEAKKEITAMAEWQRKEYGEFRDTSAEDTVERLFKGYFGFAGALAREISSADEIIAELEQGRAVIVPTNGRLLSNPYYTPPGPERHNLVIRGYDRQRDEFITNDPGTRRGQGYRYDRDVLFAAIVDYPSGYGVPVEKIVKRMIVVEK